MTGVLPGIGGSLFPSRYLADRLGAETGSLPDGERVRRAHIRLMAFWDRVLRSCGPATAVRSLFDLVAMPLVAELGFRAAAAEFDRNVVRLQLFTPAAEAVGLLVLPWARRPSAAWRNAASLAATVGARFCFVLAPPYLSLVATTRQTARRGVEFVLPDVFDPRSLPVFLALAHASAFDLDRRTLQTPIEAFVADGDLFQDRVRADLQSGVIEALVSLGATLSSAPRFTMPQQRFDEALTVVYRILFLMFAESRNLVPRGHPIYRDAYAVTTLCRESGQGRPAVGLWEALAAITRLSRSGCRTGDLIVAPFNGRLFARQSAPLLESRRSGRQTRLTTRRDDAIRVALLALATRRTRSGREDISYADLGVEQLGAVYERLLDVEPSTLEPSPQPGAIRAKPGTTPRPTASRTVPAAARRRHSDRRKRSGTFYTPQDLTEFVVRRTLAPLVSGRSPEQILALRVVDPAMGSGAFLVAACRYLAIAYEQALIETGQCGESDLDEGERANLRRLIAERCLAGIDVNTVAVQLAQLSLWLATLAQGKPLGFLDHRLRAGNSLVGAGPDDLRRVSHRVRPTRREPSLPFLDDGSLEHSVRASTRSILELTTRRDDTVEDVRSKAEMWRTLTSERSALARWRLTLSFWCARWFWPDDRPPSAAELRAAIDAILRDDLTLRPHDLTRWAAIARALAASRQFFHWPLEFPDVFYDAEGRPKERAGFDAVIGNPPWEMLRNDSGSSRRAAKVTIGNEQRPLFRFIRESGLYPSCDRGHMNLYQPFLERALSIVRPGGRVGLVLPWGLAVDDGAAGLRERLFDQSATDAIVGFDNGAGLFPIHRGLRFMALFTSPGRRTAEIHARFGVRTTEEIAALADAADDGVGGRATYPVGLTPNLLTAISGSSRRIPDLRRHGDLAFLSHLAARYPRLGETHGWNARFGRELNLTDHRASFGASGLPIVEGKHLQPFAVHVESARYRIVRERARTLAPSGTFERPRLGYRDVSAVGNRLSLIAAVLPAGVVTAHTIFCLRTIHTSEQQQFLCGLFNSYVLNAAVRLLMGGHVTTSLVESLPVPPWTASPAQRRIARLATRLADRPASEAGSERWRLGAVNAALQAAVARLYGLDLWTFEQVLESFPLVPAPDRQRAIDGFRSADQWRRRQPSSADD